MKRLLAVVMVVGIAVAAMAQTNAIIRPNQGYPYPAFIDLSADTVRSLPSANRSLGLMDTLNKKTGVVKVTAMGNKLRYCTGGTKPSRAWQGFDTLKSVTTDSGARGTCVTIDTTVAGLGFRDSMLATIKNSPRSDGTYMIIKRYKTKLLLQKTYVADTFGTKDSILTPNVGTPLFVNGMITLWGEYIPSFKYENFDSASKCTLNVLQGTWTN